MLAKRPFGKPCPRVRTNSIVLRVSGIEMARVIVNWVLCRLDCGHLVSDPVDSTVKYIYMYMYLPGQTNETPLVRRPMYVLVRLPCE